MEFTLEQLSPENLKLIFEQASYTIEHWQDHTIEDGEITQHGGITVKEDGRLFTISPKPKYNCIYFAYAAYLNGQEEGSTPEEVFLKVSNIYDHMPVHVKYIGKDENGDIQFDMINSAIFPDGESVEGKRIIKVFRLFIKYCDANREMFYQVLEGVKEGRY